MRKVIILTRENDAFDKNEELAELIKGGIRNYKPENLYAYLVALEISEGDSEVLKERYVTKKGFPEDMILPIQLFGPQARQDECQEWSRNWLEKPDKENKIPDQEAPVYWTFCINGLAEVTLLFWNRVQERTGTGVYGGNAAALREGLIKAICADCGVEGSDNMLYIHDKEWGIRGSKEVVVGGVSKLSEGVYSKFDYIAYFMHIAGGGTLFDNIVNRRFGESDLARMLAKAERECTYLKMQTQVKDEIVKILNPQSHG